MAVSLSPLGAAVGGFFTACALWLTSNWLWHRKRTAPRVRAYPLEPRRAERGTASAGGGDSSLAETVKSGAPAHPESSSSECESLVALSRQVFRPPLPPLVSSMLETTSLCYLSTFGTSTVGEPTPHLSLMRFTYVRGEEVVVMSTSTGTRKFEHMRRSPYVAILVHDFPNPARDTASQDPEADRSGCTFSITLNGKVRLFTPSGAQRMGPAWEANQGSSPGVKPFPGLAHDRAHTARAGGSW